MEQIKAMIAEMSTDEVFAGKMTALMEAGNVPAIIAAAGKKGFAFTEADWQEYSNWNEGLSGEKQSKELSPDELNGISGGGLFSGEGSRWEPYVLNCWFHESGAAEMRDGYMRKRCNQYACVAQKFSSPTWYQCKCWGTDKCKGNWHYAEGCPN